MALGCVAAEPKPAEGWSADLLNRILKAGPAEMPVARPAAAAEMTLRTYHLAHLRVGEAGRSQSVFAILEKLLPPGSALNPDVPVNSLHVFTTAAAHQAVWDYLSAVDVAEKPPAIAGAAVPEDVRAALQKLAEASDQSTRLIRAMDGLKSDVSGEIARIDARQRQQTFKLTLIGVGFGLAVLAALAWMLKFRAASAPPATPAVTALALPPEQLTTALAPVHDRLRDDMLSMLNEVAIKLQAQHHEQQQLVREQQQQIESARLALAEERQQFISEAGTMVVQAVERVDATTAKLARQQDKVAELVQELQQTVRELDETKDNLRTREIELEQERSKIAALSILLEEGGTPGGNNGFSNPGGEPATLAAIGNSRNGVRPFLGDSPPSTCTNPEPNPPTPAAPSPRYQFLPPDHPES